MKIDIKGVIVSDDYQEVYDWFGIAATSPSMVKNAIKQAEASRDKELLVEINSGGGSVFAGAEIYYALKKFDGAVNVEIPSIAASAASFIAMAGDKVSMAIMGQLMIHPASTVSQGNYLDMSDASEFLKNTDETIINAYMTKSSKSRDELRALMDKTTWFTPQQALDAGLIDEILFEKKIDAAASAEHPALVNGMLPQEVIDKVKKDILSGGLPNKLQAVNVADIPTKDSLTNQEDEGGNAVMDYETLKNEHPELFNQVKNEGIEEGKKAENARIQSIEDLELPGNEALIKAAKFENGSTAEQLAVNIIKAEKQKGANFLSNRQEDAEPLNKVPGDQAPLSPGADADQQTVASLKSVWEAKKNDK